MTRMAKSRMAYLPQVTNVATSPAAKRFSAPAQDDLDFVGVKGQRGNPSVKDKSVTLVIPPPAQGPGAAPYINVTFVHSFSQGAGIAQWLEHRTRD